MATANNPGREAILARIRTGLRTPAQELPNASSDGEIFEPVTNPLERFQQECKANLMECLMTSDTAASAQQLVQVLQSLPAGEVFIQDDLMLRSMMELSRTERPIRWSSQGGPTETSQATVTLAEALVAQTGSIFVTASCGGRGASVVAPCHIVVANVSQLVPDLKTVRRLEETSFACIISGSSRTADIEKILVQGAHGPIRLVVVLQTGL